jgi:hypothetical protein
VRFRSPGVASIVLVALATLAPPRLARGGLSPIELEVVADRDDDDADGIPDAEEAYVPPSGRIDFLALVALSRGACRSLRVLPSRASLRGA